MIPVSGVAEHVCDEVTRRYEGGMARSRMCSIPSTGSIVYSMQYRPSWKLRTQLNTIQGHLWLLIPCLNVRHNGFGDNRRRFKALYTKENRYQDDGASCGWHLTHSRRRYGGQSPSQQQSPLDCKTLPGHNLRRFIDILQSSEK